MPRKRGGNIRLGHVTRLVVGREMPRRSGEGGGEMERVRSGLSSGMSDERRKNGGQGMRCKKMAGSRWRGKEDIGGEKENGRFVDRKKTSQ